MKTLVVAAALAAGFLIATPASAAAYITWCDWDPIVLVITPGGHIVPVYDSVWTSSLLNLALPLETYKTTRVYQNGHPATAVNMAITVPTGLLFRYSTTDEVTTGLLGTGKVLATAYGTSGQTLHLKFTLPES
ncbi:MAG: hypothetical protein ACREOM_07555 [Candidatus Dormibacteraceae bacterium]